MIDKKLTSSLHTIIQNEYGNTEGIVILEDGNLAFEEYFRFLYKGIIINHNKKPSQPTLKRRFFKKKAAFFSWPGLGKEWC